MRLPRERLAGPEGDLAAAEGATRAREVQCVQECCLPWEQVHTLVLRQWLRLPASRRAVQRRRHESQGGFFLAEQSRAGDGEQRPLVPRSRCSPRLTPGARWPAQWVAGGASSPRARGVGGGRDAGPRPEGRGGQSLPGALGAGRGSQSRGAVPPPSIALKLTAPSGSGVLRRGSVVLGAAAYRDR